MREPPRDARVSEGAAPPRGRAVRRPDAPGRSEPVAGRRDRVLRRRGRVPHGVPLPAHAAPVHGAPHGGPLPDHRHPAPDPADPGQDAVGRVPPQPRRAHARDGDRRRTRLHVPHVRARPRDAHQPRHPAPARSAPAQQPPEDGADARAVVFAPGQPGPLLRRRDRDGRQRLPRRPRRRAHTDAVERGPQRGLLHREPAEAVPAGHHRSRVQLRDRQRRRAARQPRVAAVVGAASHRVAQALSGLRPRLDRDVVARQPPRARVPPA